jgi:hypothetical protein
VTTREDEPEAIIGNERITHRNRHRLTFIAHHVGE